MTAPTCSPPVDTLLKVGDPSKEAGPRDYLALSLGPEHVPEVIHASLQNPMLARSAAAGELQEFGQQHPQARDAVVPELTRLLENYAEPGRDAGVNGFIAGNLVDLKAREAAPLMERASERKPKAGSALETIQLVQPVT